MHPRRVVAHFGEVGPDSEAIRLKLSAVGFQPLALVCADSGVSFCHQRWAGWNRRRGGSVVEAWGYASSWSPFLDGFEGGLKPFAS